jgi:hypothetical protein
MAGSMIAAVFPVLAKRFGGAGIPPQAFFIAKYKTAAIMEPAIMTKMDEMRRPIRPSYSLPVSQVSNVTHFINQPSFQLFPGKQYWSLPRWPPNSSLSSKDLTVLRFKEDRKERKSAMVFPSQIGYTRFKYESDR